MEEQRNHIKRSDLKSFYLAIASVGGTGKLPLMPGTWGSLIVLPVYLLLGSYNFIFLTLTVILLIVSIPISSKAEGNLAKKDPSIIVIDEFVGQMITLLYLPNFGIGIFFIGFVLFRFCDIIKPPPANISQRLYGGWGIVLDDVFAGIYANLILHILLRIV